MLHSMITKRTYLPIFSHTTTSTLLARRLRIGIRIMLRHKDNRSACTICGQLWGKKRYQNCRDYQRYYKRGYWQYLKQKCRVQQPSSVAASCVGFCFTSFCNNLPWLYSIGVVAERFNVFLIMRDVRIINFSCFLYSIKSSRNSFTDFSSKALKGSSKTNRFWFSIMAWIIPSFCFIPCEYLRTGFFPLGLNRNNLLYSAARQWKLPSGSLAIWIR